MYNPSISTGLSNEPPASASGDASARSPYNPALLKYFLMMLNSSASVSPTLNSTPPTAATNTLPSIGSPASSGPNPNSDFVTPPRATDVDAAAASPARIEPGTVT